jgi:hypothetical protein
MKMIPSADNRACPRVVCLPPLGLACVACWTNESFLAAAHNICENGLYIETWFPLEIDDHVLFHPKRHLPMGVPGKLLSENIGIVMWSDPVTRNDHSFHGAGIKLLTN